MGQVVSVVREKPLSSCPPHERRAVEIRELEPSPCIDRSAKAPDQARIGFLENSCRRSVQTLGVPSPSYTDHAPEFDPLYVSMRWATPKFAVTAGFDAPNSQLT